MVVDVDVAMGQAAGSARAVGGGPGAGSAAVGAPVEDGEAADTVGQLRGESAGVPVGEQEDGVDAFDWCDLQSRYHIHAAGVINSNVRQVRVRARARVRA